MATTLYEDDGWLGVDGPTWQAELEALAEAESARAQAIVGKTIAAAQITPSVEGCDDLDLLVLTMTDGSEFVVRGGYAGYTGKSADEYQMRVSVHPKTQESAPPTSA